MSRYVMALSVVGLLLSASQAVAGGPSGGSASGCGGACYVEKTIYCPEWVTETRTVTCCEYKQESREVTETIYRCVPVQKEIQRSCTVMVPEQRVRTCQYTVCTPVVKQVERQYTVCVPEYRDVERQYTVMVPTQETRQGVRRVCHMVPEEITNTVCVDRGCWQTQMVEVPCSPCRRGCFRRRCGSCCGGCGSCCQPMTTTVCQRVWIPNIVQEEVTCTVYKQQITEEPYEYTVTVCKPETRTCTVKVCEMRQEVRTRTCSVTTYETSVEERQVPYTVCVPQEKTWTETVTTYTQVPEEVTRTITVCVPVQVQKEIQVNVCRMVPKTIQVPVCGCGGCNTGCGRVHYRRRCGC